MNGRVGDRDGRLVPGQSLAWRRPPWHEDDVPLGFAVLFRDAHLLAVAKPRGLPSVPNGGFLEHTLLARVRRAFPEAVPHAPPWPRHLRHSAVRAHGRGPSRSRGAVARRAGSKRNTARSSPAAPGRSFTVDAPIGPVPHPRLGSVHALSSGGRPAISHVRVIATRGDATLVSVSIPTGRPHQIRIHLAAAGHPLVGDPLYAIGGGFTDDPARPGTTGYWLHALRLALAHPATGERLEIDCAPPPVLR